MRQLSSQPKSRRGLLVVEVVINDASEVKDRVVVDLAKTFMIKVFAEPYIEVENYFKKM